MRIRDSGPLTLFKKFLTSQDRKVVWDFYGKIHQNQLRAQATKTATPRERDLKTNYFTVFFFNLFSLSNVTGLSRSLKFVGTAFKFII